MPSSRYGYSEYGDVSMPNHSAPADTTRATQNASSAHGAKPVQVRGDGSGGVLTGFRRLLCEHLHDSGSRRSR